MVTKSAAHFGVVMSLIVGQLACVQYGVLDQIVTKVLKSTGILFPRRHRYTIAITRSILTGSTKLNHLISHVLWTLSYLSARLYASFRIGRVPIHVRFSEHAYNGDITVFYNS